MVIINSDDWQLHKQIRYFAADIYTNDEPLLNYVRDIQLANETWWQADDLTKDWFPHPPLKRK